MAEFKVIVSDNLGPDVDDKGCPHFCDDGVIGQTDFISGEYHEFDCPHCKK